MPEGIRLTTWNDGSQILRARRNLLIRNGTFGFLLVVTAAAVALRSSRPYLLVGWLWYAAMLVPVIGLVQVGLQARADRYMYLPLIGLSIALVAVENVWLTDDRRSAVLPSSAVIGLVLGLLLPKVAASLQTALVGTLLPSLARRDGLDSMGLAALAALPFLASLVTLFAGRIGPRKGQDLLVEALAADEAFITSASTFVMPVVEIDGQEVGAGTPGPVATRLREIYIEESRRAAI